MLKIFFVSFFISLSIYANDLNHEDVNAPGFINTDFVNMRSEPSSQSESKGLLNKYTGVFILKKTKMKCTIGNNSNFWFQCYFDFGIKNEPFWIFGDYLSYGIVDITKIISELPSKSFKSTIYKNISNITNSQNIWSNIPKGVEPLCTLCSYEFFDNCIIYQGLYAAIYKIDSITEKDNTLKIQTTVYASDFVEILTGSKHCFEIEFDNDAIIIDGASYYR